MRALIAGLLFAMIGCGTADAGSPVASEQAETRTAGQLALTSEAFSRGGAIPLRYSAYGDGLSPPLAWTASPSDTRSYVLLVEDPDATSVRPYIHWMAWNIDPGTRSRPEGVRPTAAGMVQGRNSRGRTGLFGPRPHGSSAHRYFFQVFALDTELALPAASSRNDLLGAMKGHVVAAGTLIGTFRQPDRR
jgi:Raf kinase inhibitor-like YbhB/YbcL family protein